MAVLFTGKETFSGPATTGLAHRNATPLAHYAVSILHYGGRVRAAETDGANVIASRMPDIATGCYPYTCNFLPWIDGNLFQTPPARFASWLSTERHPFSPHCDSRGITHAPSCSSIAPAVPPTPPIQPTLARARELVAENREADAAALLERSPTPETDALHLQIALRAATGALDARNMAAATAWLDRGLARNPADPQLNYFRGNLLLDSGNTAAAAESFRRSLAADPHRLDFALALASTLLADGTPETIPSLLSAFPNSTQAQLALAEACERIADLATARRACERAGRLAPDQPLVWDRLAQLCEKTGDGLGALVARTRAAAIRAARDRPHE